MPQDSQLRIELRGNLAAILTAAQKANGSPETTDLFVPIQLVAGACSRRYLQLWIGRRESKSHTWSRLAGSLSAWAGIEERSRQLTADTRA